MNKKEFEQFMYYQFPTAFEVSFAREMLQNILDYADGMEEIEQYNFLCDMIPQVAEIDVRKVFY